MTHPISTRSRRTLASILALSLAAALVLVAGPASAADPTSAENFSPDAAPPTNATDDTELSVVSDRADGGNSTFHATTVASTNATLVQYYICPTAFPDAQVDAGADDASDDPTVVANGCGSPVGVDATGALPPAPGVPAGAGEVYEADIDVSVDGSRDFVAWVCGGSSTTDADCDAEVEPGLMFDDGSTTPATASSSGEITSPLHGANLSNAGFAVSARTSPDVTGVTFCLAIDNVPAADPADEGDGTAGDGDPGFCVTDADFAGSGTSTTIKSDVTPNNPSSQQATFKTWSVSYSDAETPDNYELALAMFEGTSTDGDPVTGSPAAESGAGSCLGGTNDCQLDSHYVVTTPPVGTKAVVAFPDEGGTSTLPNNCTETEATGTAEEEPKQYSRVQGCILDQSDNNITNNVHWAFSITQQDPASSATDETGFECLTAAPSKNCSDTNFPNASQNSGEHQVQIGAPPASFGWPNYECNGRAPGPDVPPGSGCPTGAPAGGVGADGVQNDLNADRFYEQSDGDPGQTSGGTAAIADEVLDLHTTGIYQILFCLDSTDDAKTSATPCSNDTVVATGTKTVTGPVAHVHVKRQDQADARCHTGDSTTSVPAGITLNLRGCAVAVVDTVEQASIGAHVLWFVNPQGTTGDVGTLASQTNTTDSQGHATAQVSAPSTAEGKSTTVRFCLDDYPASTAGGQDGNATCDAAESASGAPLTTQADIRIDWAGDSAEGPCDPLRLKAEENEVLLGTSGNDRICGFGGADTIRGGDGNDTLLGGTGDDILSGGSGKDALKGGGRDDILKGGSGRDNLKGGRGDDATRGGAGKDFCKGETERSCERG